jgi:outer membrane beta-barrel protein
VKKFTFSFVTFLFLAFFISNALAGQEGKSLKDRIKSVVNRKYAKHSRLELTVYPMTSMSINDAFYQKFGGGLGLGYHFNESFGLQLMGTYSLNRNTSYASYYGSNEATTVPWSGKRKILVGADLCWAPVYGKVNLAAEFVMHFDTYIIAGVTAISGEQESDSSFAFGAAFGIGMHFFMTRSFALKLEIRDHVLFNDQVSYSGLDPVNDVQHQLIFNIGLSIFFLEGSQEE